MSRRERAARSLERRGAGELLRSVGAWRGLLVLNYHRIAHDAGALSDTDTWSATPASLDEQLTLIGRHFDLVGPGVLAHPPSRTRRRVLITFDDGYRDNYELALPILVAHGVEAVFFICTGFIDHPRRPWWEQIAAMVRATAVARVPPSPWLPDGLDVAGVPHPVTVNRLRAVYESLPAEQAPAFLDRVGAALGQSPDDAPRPDLWMSWEMIRELREAGMSIGGHTVDHLALARTPVAEQGRQIGGSLARIEAETGERPALFSYPYGRPESFDARTVAAAREAGVRFAFSYYGGHNRRGSWEPFDIRRVSVSAAASPEAFRASLALPRLFARW